MFNDNVSPDCERERLSRGTISPLSRRAMARNVAALALIAAAAQVHQAARAQDASQAQSGSELQEVTVTATRREESLQSVPLSVTALTSGDLEKIQAVNLFDLQRQIPSLSTNGNTISIRGIGSNSSAGASTTGIYVDDTPLAIIGFGYGAQNPVPLLFDLDRVEILRGPQGTLFGAGAEGGVVRYITPQPSLTEWSGYAKMGAGQIEGGGINTDVAAAFGGPLVDNSVGIRVSAEMRNRGGWINALDQWTHEWGTRNYNAGIDRTFRVALTWEPAEHLKITPSLHYQSDYSKDSGNLNTNVGTASVYWSDPSRGLFQIPNSGLAYTDQRWFLPALRVQYDFPGMQLISSTSYADVATHTQVDGSWMIANYIPASLWLPGVSVVQPDGFNLPPGAQSIAPYETHIFNTEQLTQEVRLASTGTSKFQWIVGAFYTHSENYNNTVDVDKNYNQFLVAATGYTVPQYYGLPAICEPGWGCDVGFYSPFYLTAYDLAGFGEATYSFTDWLKGTIGVRETSAHLKFNDVTTGYIEGETDLVSGATSVTAFTPKFNLSIQPDRNNMYYATVAKGFRDPAGNEPVSQALCAPYLQELGLKQAPTTFGPDYTWSYEVGAKNTTAGGHLVVDSSAYLIKWNNIQTSINMPCAYSFILNSGQVTVKGFETQANAAFGHISADFSLGYMHGVYTEQPVSVKGSKPAASLGDRLPDPDLKIAVGVQYSFEVKQRNTFARLDYQYSHYNQGPTVGSNNSNPNDATYIAGTELPQPYNYVTGRTGVTLGNLEVSLFVDNLLNSSQNLQLIQNYIHKDYYTFRSWRPRTFMLEGRYSFQ